jgi:serine/threonine protein kinase
MSTPVGLRGRAGPNGVALTPVLLTLVTPYDILGELGRGGMGVVLLARQNNMNRLVAIKRIREGALAGPDELARFCTEVEAAARLRHPNIVEVYGYGYCDQDGLPSVTMEYVAGTSLDKVLTGVPQPACWAAEVVEALARAVAYAHCQGVVHRDLKPSNVLLAESGDPHPCNGGPRPMARGAGRRFAPADLPPLAPGRYTPKLTDFGLAKCLDDPSGLTQPNTVMGTPSYMAPEQARGLSNQVDGRADIYSLGVILYEMLTGRPPFKGATDWDTVLQVRSKKPAPSIRPRPGLPRGLSAVCRKCLEKDPAKRYASAEELADQLDRFRGCGVA